MPQLAGLLSWVFIGVLAWMGWNQYPLWVPIAAAPIGAGIYVLLRFHQLKQLTVGGPSMASMVPMWLVTQAATAAIPFGLGYLLSWMLQ